MKYVAILTMVLMAAVCMGQTFTDVDNPQHHGFQELNETIDANFALLESGGTIDGSFDTLTVDNGASIQGAVTSISTNGATTNVIVTVDAVVDGEFIKDDTIDDDSIDFSDVTGADLTLSDCGAVGCTTLSVSSNLTLAITTASGSATALMTNAPACTEETPIWITVTVSGTDYVIPAWDLD